MRHIPGVLGAFSHAAQHPSFAPSSGPGLRTNVPTTVLFKTNTPTTVRPELVEGRFNAGRPQPRRLQRGIAALEFALLALFVMLPLFLGIFVFWEVLQTQQVLTRATGDAARQVSRALHSTRIPKPDGSYPSDTELRNTTATLVRESINAALRSHLGSDAGNRLTVELSGDGPMTLNVSYQRPALLGSAGGLNFIEPETIQAHSSIQWQ